MAVEDSIYRGNHIPLVMGTKLVSPFIMPRDSPQESRHSGLVQISTVMLNNRRHTSQAQTQGEHQHRVCLHCGEDILGMGYPLDRQSCLYSILICPKAGNNYVFMPG